MSKNKLPHAEICSFAARELAALISRKELSPVEVTKAILERADAVQPILNCFITICHNEALEAARAAEKALMRGEKLPLLHGVPFTAKDLIDTRGIKTTYGSLLYADHVPEEDTVALSRMKQAGGILIGKTTTPEFGAKCLTDSPLFGATANAWNVTRTSGGSSGGAAAATAAGIAPLAISTDGGGSTRIPAACNGVVGMKQSLGVVPHDKVNDAFSTYTYVNPTTRNVADAALMLQVLGGEHHSDPWSIGVQPTRYFDKLFHWNDLRGKRILFCATIQGQPISMDVEREFYSALDTFRSLGAELTEMSSDGFDVEPIWRVINHTSWRGRFDSALSDHAEKLSPNFLKQVSLAQHVDGVQYQKAMFQRSALFRHVQLKLENFDFIVTPTLSRTALPIDQDLFGDIEIDGKTYPEVRRHWFPWLMPFNLTGHPAISVPSGTASDGLPIGLQIVGAFKQDGDVLRVAALFESTHQPLRPLPKIAFDSIASQFSR